jgi:putative restriction endonuclease
MELARLLGRTPASVARKLGNFGAFDPELSKKGISGLIHGSKLDKEIWDEFHHDWNQLVLDANDLRFNLDDNISTVEETLVSPSGPSEIIRQGRVRVHQAFFREAVLSSYNTTCCITGIRIPDCLIASHIIPWSISEKKRADPSNGLCLSATFDRLFDRGLVAITCDLKIQVSRRLLEKGDPPIQKHIAAYHGGSILLPHRFVPASECLEWHHKNVFQS